MTDKLRIGVMGCGNISTTYFKFVPLFKGIEITACADLNPEMARARAEEYGVKAMKPAALLASPDIDLHSEPDGARCASRRFIGRR